MSQMPEKSQLIRESMLEQFARDWNRESTSVSINVLADSEMHLPSSIEVRFSPLMGAVYDFEELMEQIESLSRMTMVVASSADAVDLGIIDLKVASRKFNYDETVVIGVLRWLVAWLLTPSEEIDRIFELLEYVEEN